MRSSYGPSKTGFLVLRSPKLVFLVFGIHIMFRVQFSFLLIHHHHHHHHREPSRRCTTVSRVDSVPPEVSYRTVRIILELVEPLVPGMARWATPCTVRRSTSDALTCSNLTFRDNISQKKLIKLIVY